MIKIPSLTYDEEHDLFYLYLSNNEIAGPTQIINDSLFVDLDKDGEVVGLEAISLQSLRDFIKEHSRPASN